MHKRAHDLTSLAHQYITLSDTISLWLHTMHRFISLVLVFCLSSQSTDAAAAISPIVECSTIKPSTGSSFQVCATGDWYTPGVCGGEGCDSIPQTFGNGYDITQGLKDGTDTSSLSEANRKKAYNNGIRVSVDWVSIKGKPQVNCTVSVSVKSKLTKCKSCNYCGNNKFTSDCTNVANGRKAQCELSTVTDIYYPLTLAALPTPPTAPKPPVRAPIKWVPSPRAPVKLPPAPVKAPVKPPVPVKAPARAPIKWIIPTPTN
jgi:hypothetical protein